MRIALVGLVVTAAVASAGPAGAAAAPSVSFSVLPEGWHVAGTANGAYALSWRQGRSGWASSMPRNGIAVEVFFTRQAARYPPLELVLRTRSTTTREGSPDTLRYRVHGRVDRRNVEVRVSIRRPHPTAAQLKVAQRVVRGIRFASTAPSQPATPPPVGCTPTRTRSLIARFVTAFNRGDQPTLVVTWAAEDEFVWYSVTTEPGARRAQESAHRDTLLPYFATRHAADERLTITSLKINGTSAGGYQNFEFRLTRDADDLPGGPVAYVGKGASSCSTGRLMVWAMNAAA
jgi:hypothetical protein